MVVSNIKANFECNAQKVWNVVTSLRNYQWRSDLNNVEVLDEKRFVEYAKNGYPTTFTVTCEIPYERWEFDIENSNMKGHWVGIFKEENGMTEIDFTENVQVKKIIMKPFVKWFLKKQQRLYVLDLKRVLE